VELMIAIGIIGVMATVVIGSTSSSRARARDNRRIIDMKEIQLGLALYYDVNKYYPAGDGSSDASVLITPLVGSAYLPEIPADPSGSNYEYKAIVTGSINTGYCLGAKLEVVTPPGDNDPGNCQSKLSGSTATYKVKR